jgi:hypothetical protein
MNTYDSLRAVEFNQLTVELGMEGHPVLYLVEYMLADCFLATDSGGKKRYVLGRLDDGTPFCETPSFLAGLDK